MAGTSLLALLDDIASTLDDVALMTKVAAKKTAGVVGDDLALNAQQVTGVPIDRELPVVWAVAKGSAINKLILIPLALLISFFLPPLVTILLLIGGLFLCYEGFEKVFEKFFHGGESKSTHESHSPHHSESEKIKGAIRTDFILSAEIIVISLGTVTTMPIHTQILVLSAIGVGMTVGVYGLVGLIVKLDDLGLWLSVKTKPLSTLGRGILLGAPWLMKGLGMAGTVAMFLVGGGLVVHTFSFLHHLVEDLPGFFALFLDLIVGTLSGGIIVGAKAMIGFVIPSKP
jgi:uncharacterized protein